MEYFFNVIFIHKNNYGENERFAWIINWKTFHGMRGDCKLELFTIGYYSLPSMSMRFIDNYFNLLFNSNFIMLGESMKSVSLW